jgi:Fe-S-cluster-containing dehydrogenase component
MKKKVLHRDREVIVENSSDRSLGDIFNDVMEKCCFCSSSLSSQGGPNIVEICMQFYLRVKCSVDFKRQNTADTRWTTPEDNCFVPSVPPYLRWIILFMLEVKRDIEATRTPVGIQSPEHAYGKVIGACVFYQGRHVANKEATTLSHCILNS